MASLTIGRKLNPNEELNLGIQVSLFGEQVEAIFDPIVVPRACPLMSKYSNIKLKVENKTKTITGDNKVFNLTKYRKIGNAGKNKYKLRLIISNNKSIGDLAPDDNVIITCSNAGLNNVPAIVLNSDGKLNYVDLAINNSYNLNNNSGNGPGTVTEVQKKIKEQDITVSLNMGDPKKSFANTYLVAEKSIKTLKKGNVEDIIIYAYKQFKEGTRSTTKYKLMINDEEINLKTPPKKNDIIEYQKTPDVYKKSFKVNDAEGQKILCYVAIARYIYNGTSWEGEWLQTNASNEVIWGQAK